MRTRMKLEKLHIFLLVILALSGVKLIFLGSNVDEGYAIELAYRIAHGDAMITQMWEPHQTSAIFGALLVKLFWVFTGGSNTGIVLFMHFCGIVLQALVAYFLYRVLCGGKVSREVAFYLACLYFLSFPKGVIAPEYSNLQNWFGCCTVLCFICYARGGKRELLYLTLAGVSLACAIFAYPSMIILYPLILILLWNINAKRPGGSKLARDFGCVTLPCIMIGGAFILYVLSYCPLAQLWKNIGYILSDGSHKAGLMSRMGSNLCYLGLLLGRVVVYLLAGYFASRFMEKKMHLPLEQNAISGKTRTATVDKMTAEKLTAVWIALLISIVVQILTWLLKDEFVNQPQAEMVLLTVFGVICAIKQRTKTKTKTKTKIKTTTKTNQNCNIEAVYLIIFSCTGFLATIILSNFKLIELVVYLVLAAIGGACMLCQQTESEEQLQNTNGTGETVQTAEIKQTGKSFLPVLMRTVLVLWILSLSFGRVWVTSQGGELHTTPFEVRNIQKSGPGIGIFTNYMTGYRYNVMASEWDQIVQDGESVLYVGPSSYYYMFGDVTISAPNTISTPIYDENLLIYWEQNPDRYPDVVLVEGCYGDMVYPDDSFIMQWLQNEYQASTVTDYEYVRVYRR